MASNFLRTWALVSNGIISALETAAHELPHPFGEPGEGVVIVDVTGAPHAGIGHLVDAKGNVSAVPGRGVPLPPHQTAYHDLPHPEPAKPEPEPEPVAEVAPVAPPKKK